MSYSIEQLVMWFTAVSFKNIYTKYDILKKFAGVEEIWYASEKEIADKTNTMIASFIQKSKGKLDNLIERVEKLNVKFITVVDEEYPDLLKAIPYPPLGLFVAGTMPDKRKKHIAIVGTRNITSYGRMCTDEIATELAKRDCIIVSGMARGADGIAHRGALKVGGKTIAVLGSGINVPYPIENKELMQEIISSGNAVVSEYPPDRGCRQHYFPQRNRIISGLSHIIIVTEAALKSGTSITASRAVEQGRDVYVVPGNINSIYSQGCNNLIKDGANILTSIPDLLIDIGEIKNLNCGMKMKSDNETEKVSEKGIYSKPRKKQSKNKENKKNEEEISKNINLELEPLEKMLYDCIGYDRITLDEIIEKTNISIQEAQLYLTFLESKSLIKSAGGSYQRI